MAFSFFQRFHPAVVLLCITILAGCSGNGEQQQFNAPHVDVMAVYEIPVANKWDAVGRVDSKDIVDIKSRVEGFLIKREFVEGDIVPKDKVLFKIDPKPFEADLLLAKASVEKAKAALIEAKQNLERGKQLYAGKNISKSQLDAYTSTERQAAAELDAAKAQVYTATINLGYTTITAPFKGRIGRTIYSVGNLISTSSGTLATMFSIDPIYVYFTVDEKDVVTYRSKWGYKSSPNLRFMLRLPNGAMYDQEGKLDFAQPFIDKDTGTIDLRCVFPNPESLLLSGMYVSVIVEDADKKRMPVIPQASVQQTQTGYTVVVLDKKNVATTRKVELGMRLDAMWVVLNGLQAGERIIVEGLQKVQIGKPVTPKIVTVDTKTGAVIKGAPQGTQQPNIKTPSSVVPPKTGASDNTPENPRWTETNPGKKDDTSPPAGTIKQPSVTPNSLKKTQPATSNSGS